MAAVPCSIIGNHSKRPRSGRKPQPPTDESVSMRIARIIERGEILKKKGENPPKADLPKNLAQASDPPDPIKLHSNPKFW